MSASAMLAAARRTLGMAGRPNAVTKDYAARHGEEFLRAPWCNMSITRWARESGNAAAVLPAGDRAYTVWHAEDGKRLGLWHAGTAVNLRRAEPGAIVFFDWGGSDSIPYIDHVGIVERVLPDGRLQTIEGNSGDACKRRVRAHGVIAGFWNPPYGVKDLLEELVDKLPLLVKGAEKKAANRPHIKTAFKLLDARGYPLAAGVDDMTFGESMDKRVREFQKAKKLVVDGEIGPKTWAKLILP